MEKRIIKAEIRALSTKHSVRGIRNTGYIPGVLYGKGIGSLPVKVWEKDLTSLGGANLIEVSLPGKAYPAIIREIQKDPLSGKVSHVDFQQVDMNETIKTEVPVHFTGEPVGVKNGGVLQYGERILEVEAQALELPEYIELDVSRLDLGQKLTAADIKVHPNVKIISDPAMVLVVMTSPRKAEEAAPVVTEHEEELKEDTEVTDD